MTETAREIIRREYGSSRNFMTPHKIRIGKISKTMAFELSNGNGFDHSSLYGVSFVEIKEDGSTVRRTDISKMFFGIGKAEAYIEQIKEEEKGALSSPATAEE